ncbi:hypothetical protein BH10ACI3_BH10ACI3_05780 [soil metagenome]
MIASAKVVSFCLFILFCAAAVLPAAAQNTGIPPVILFNAADGKGEGQAIPAGVFKVDAKQLGSTAISVTVAKGFVVKFCQTPGPNNDGGGKCEEYAQGTYNLLSVDFTYVRVAPEHPAAPITLNPVPADPPNRPVAPPVRATVAPPMIVYEAMNWGGRSQTFTPGMYRFNRAEFGHINDNMAMSVVIAPGFRGRFCTDEGVWARGTGDCEEHDDGKFNLRFANSISFIEVIDLKDKSPADDKMPVTLYEDKDQGGKRQGFDEGIFVASLGQLGKVANDTASSVTVKSGYRVMVCGDEVINGSPEKCEEYGPGKHDLNNNNAASYVKVWKSEK